MILKIDIDDVLRGWVESVRSHYRKDYPMHKIKKVTAWGLEPFFPLGKNIYKYAFERRAKEILEEAKPLPGAVAFVKRLVKEGHKVILTTSQPVGLEQFTLNWIHKHKIPYHAIAFVHSGTGVDKSFVKGNVLLDDGEHNLKAERLSDTTIPICFDRPWNQGWQGLRVHSYDEFLGIIKMLP